MIGFKLFVLCIILLIPVAMLGFGYHWKSHPPKQINSGYGYRTRRSMHSIQTWDYAHEVCARVWRIAGWWTFAFSVVAVTLLMVVVTDIDVLGTYCFALTLLQMFPLLSPILITERALKRKFHM